MKKIVITGMGAVTPIGIGVDKYWENLIAGVSGIDTLTRVDTERLNVKVGAEVKNFDASEYMSKKTEKELSLFMQYGYAAAMEALNQSGIENGNDKMAVIMGTALSGITSVCETQKVVDEGKSSKVNPRFITQAMGNICASIIATEKQITGPCMTVGTACSSGGDALSLACMTILCGDADAALVVGAEATLTWTVISSLATARALSANPNPKSACCPFDESRSGFIMGEGGGAVVIETEESALKRGAVILGEIAGFANNNDAYHIMHPHPEGDGAKRCMQRALDRAGMKPEEIGYINTHGTSTKVGDVIETGAIKSIFGKNVPVSSTKAATGHLMGAGGLTELIACVNAVRYGVLPPTLNLKNPDPECDLDYIPNTARKCEINAAMSNAFGFGGQNSSIIVKKY